MIFLFCMCYLSLLHHVLNWKVFYIDVDNTNRWTQFVVSDGHAKCNTSVNFA